MEFANVPFKGWIIGPDVHGLLDGPNVIVCLSTHYGENVHTNTMPRSLIMVIDGGREPDMFLQPLPQSTCRLPCLFLLTIHLVTLVPLDYLTFLSDITPFPEGHQTVLEGVAYFEMDLNPHLTPFLKLLQLALHHSLHYTNDSGKIATTLGDAKPLLGTRCLPLHIHWHHKG